MKPVQPPACTPATGIRRHQSGDLQWLVLETGGRPRFLHLTAHCAPSADCHAPCAGLAAVLGDHHARPVFHDEFCSFTRIPCWRSAIAATTAHPTWPVTRLEGHDSPPGLANGFQAWAVAGCHPTPVRLGNRVAGTRFEDDEAVYLALGDLRPGDPGQPRPDQARQVLDAMLELLDQAGLAFRDVVRTWFYLDHILEWYDAFNVVRNAFFEQHGVFDHLVPASTGIGCANHAGAAVAAKLLAIRPKHGRVFAVESPLQCPATNYRSAFSRAVEVELPSHRQLYVSGTASIAHGGQSAHIADSPAQIDLTMQVVHAILTSRGMDWHHAARAVAYLRRPHDRELLDRWLADHRLTGLPLVAVQSDICRDDLLFELELDALAAR